MQEIKDSSLSLSAAYGVNVPKRLWERSHKRFGNGTCRAGEARAMAIFCLAMVAKAKLARAASGRNPREYNETTARFDFRVALLHALDLAKPVTARKHS